MFFDIVKTFGLPLALLAVFAVYHVGVVKTHAALVATKDEEIKRINELRVSESRLVTDRMIAQDEKNGAILTSIGTTMTVLADRIKT